MGRLTASILRQFRTWERPAQIAFLLALILLIAAGLVIAVGPFSLRQPAVIGFFGLVIVAQVIYLWANRGMVTAYTQAQRAYLAEDFETARNLLEELRAGGKADMRVLTLLGNTYRQMGQLELGEAVLLEALDIQPNHHFPLYGFGRTLLVQGRYAEAVDALTQSLDAGAPPVVQLDLAEAYYRMGDAQQAIERLQAVSTDEPHRALMSAYLRYRLGVGDRPDDALLQAGLPYWQASAERYRHTAYGQALLADVQALLKEF